MVTQISLSGNRFTCARVSGTSRCEETACASVLLELPASSFIGPPSASVFDFRAPFSSGGGRVYPFGVAQPGQGPLRPPARAFVEGSIGPRSGLEHDRREQPAVVRLA